MITQEQYDKAMVELHTKWHNNGRTAGQHDGWMRPCVDEIENEAYEESDQEVVQREEECWSETDHFNIKYRSQMFGDVCVMFGRAGLAEAESTYEGEWMIEAMQDLVAEFWEGYHETAKTYELVAAHRKEIGILGRQI